MKPMADEEVFIRFPRPWRLCADTGTILDSVGEEVLTVDSLGQRYEAEVIALAMMIVQAMGTGDTGHG